MATTLAPRLARRTLTLAHALRPIDRERPSRRVLNIAVAAAGIVLALPLMAVIALLIKLPSRGPVLVSHPPNRLDPPGPPPPGGDTPRRVGFGGQPLSLFQIP